MLKAEIHPPPSSRSTSPVEDGEEAESDFGEGGHEPIKLKKVGGYPKNKLHNFTNIYLIFFIAGRRDGR